MMLMWVTCSSNEYFSINNSLYRSNKCAYSVEFHCNDCYFALLSFEIYNLWHAIGFNDKWKWHRLSPKWFIQLTAETLNYFGSQEVFLFLEINFSLVDWGNFDCFKAWLDLEKEFSLQKTLIFVAYSVQVAWIFLLIYLRTRRALLNWLRSSGDFDNFVSFVVQ